MENIGVLREELTKMCAFHRKYLSRRVDRVFGVFCVLFCILVHSTSAYNLDLETVTVHKGDGGSMFGYTVALHQDQGSKWLLIGAPKSQTRQPGVTRGGAVYRCPIDAGSRCQEIPFDTKGNGIRHNGTHYRDVEDKSNQWFGASLYTSDNGIIVACAPRYVYFSTRLDKREPVGTCYVARSSSQAYEEYSPCRTRGLWSYHREGSCQAGMSVALADQGRQLLIGAVGSWYWQGQLFNFNFEDGPGRYHATPEGRARDDYSYMGYSSAIGNFDNDDREDYVVGVPRGRQLMGKVVIYTQNLTQIETIRGEQFGSYFGYSVAVADLDNNGLDDVIIGAPFFSDYNSDDSFETGRVYIFYQNSARKFSKRKKDILDGHHSQSRFGLSVAAIGDIDYDGFNDIAIGAPYGGEDGRGVVYIYHGSDRGIITDVQQAIGGEDVLEGVETFGWSLTGRVDMDDNEYPDVLVGAYQSNKAMFLRSRPVVRVNPTINIVPENITLENKDCVLKNQEFVTCIKINTCITYLGIGVPDELDFELKWTLDSLKNDTSRVYLLHTETTREEIITVKVQRDKNKCQNIFAYIVNDVRDKLTPIVVEYSFELQEKTRNKRDVTPILNQRIPTIAKGEANILKECGPDNLCIPDLTVTAVQTKDSYTLGEEEKIEILVFIENKGEDSYESMLKITFPPGVKFYKNDKQKFEIPFFCDSSTSNQSYITCDLGNPLPSKSRTNFTLLSTPEDINGTFPDLVFKLEVNSSNIENFSDTGNNIAIVTIPIQQSASLRIGGNEYPEQFIYSQSDVRIYRETEQVGPIIEHEYIVSNQGPTGVKASLVKIEWPSMDKNGLYLLHLMDDLADRIIVSRPDISCIALNDSITTYSETNQEGTVVKPKNNGKLGENQLKRHTREVTEENDGVDKRDVEKRSRKEFITMGCVPDELGCTYIHCTIGYMEPEDYVKIKIRARIWTSTLIHKKLAEPFYFVSQATAEVLSMPFSNMKIAASTLSRAMYRLRTYVNPERLHPKRKGIEPWIIGVAVSAGLLLLLLLIILLWWCGFFRRRRPEEQAYLAPAPQNGDYKSVGGGPPDERYKYN